MKTLQVKDVNCWFASPLRSRDISEPSCITYILYQKNEKSRAISRDQILLILQNLKDNLQISIISLTYLSMSPAGLSLAHCLRERWTKQRMPRQPFHFHEKRSHPIFVRKLTQIMLCTHWHDASPILSLSLSLDQILLAANIFLFHLLLFIWCVNVAHKFNHSSCFFLFSLVSLCRTFRRNYNNRLFCVGGGVLRGKKFFGESIANIIKPKYGLNNRNCRLQNIIN